MRRILVCLVVALSMTTAATLGTARAAPTLPPMTPTAEGTGGAAASVDPLATQTAIDVLRNGGNAVDAAVAAAATLGVVEPFSSGIGGGGFMLLYLAKSHRVVALDSRESAPASATPTMFQDPIGDGAAVRRRRRERPVGRRARDARELGHGAAPLRHHHALAGARAGDPDRAARVRRRPDVPRSGRVERRTLRGDHAERRAVPARRRAAVGRLGLQEPRPGEDLLAARAPGHRPVLHRQGRRRDRPDRAAPAGRAGLDARRPARRDDHRRPGRLPGADPASHPGELPRLPGVRDVPAVQRRLDHRRDAEHPVELRPGRREPLGRAVPLPRGLAPGVRRPRRLPRRPGVLRRAAARSPVAASSPPSGRR